MSAKNARAIQDLLGLGPKSQAMLAAAGVKTVAQLQSLGAVRAYAMVKATHANASLNLLWALEGALTGLPWTVVAREHRLSLLLALEQLTSASQSGAQAADRPMNHARTAID